MANCLVTSYQSDSSSSFVRQRILIAVLPKTASKALLDSAQRLLEVGSIVRFIDSLVERDAAIFYSQHLDLWSMGDSFERLLRPKSKLRRFDHGSFQLYAIPRESLRFRLPARDKEEELFRDVLRHAKSIYRRVSPDAYLFVLRRVFGGSAAHVFPQE